MMKRQLRPWLLALSGAAAFAFVAPATRADDKVIIEKRSEPRTTTFHYVYYPESETYFVPEKHIYMVREGERFREMREAPANLTLGTSVNLDVDQPDPWTKHDIIVKKYGHGKTKTKEVFKDEDGNVRSRETIRDRDGNVIIKERNEKDD